MNKENAALSYPMLMGAIGIVYGDIGTSPLYALKKCFSSYGLLVSEGNVFGIISLIFWSLFIVISLKYIKIILKADNNGEGGILSLTALCLRLKSYLSNKVILTLGVIGASLFYGDGVLTPAISVLGALEGLELISPTFNDYVEPIAIAILVGLFITQSRGSQKIGQLFGPVMLVWFITIGLLGLIKIINMPHILNAINPMYAFSFFIRHGGIGVLTLGAVVLVITGGEALYADIGHFGRKPIERAWFYLVFPCLLLNYFGQGALLLQNPMAIENPFYNLAPGWGLYPLVLLSTIATIIASQAIISGVFSMSWQAIQLDYLPRMRVVHTSFNQIGQVYVPVMNYAMMAMTIMAVLIFHSSENLASAYGINVTCIMTITTVLTSLLAYYKWKWSELKIGLVFGPLILIDVTFLLTNLVKIMEGGWFPVGITIISFWIITTWQRGRHSMIDDSPKPKVNLKVYLQDILRKSPIRIPGAAVFMCRSPKRVPNSLVIHLQHYKLLHEKIVFLSVSIEDIPRVSIKERIKIETLAENIYQVTASYGFTEVPNIMSVFDKLRDYGISLDLNKTSFILSRGLPVASPSTRLTRWSEPLFIFLAHNAMNATDFYKIPHQRVVELGVRFKI